MKNLDIVTIVLDGMPFLPIQLSNYNRINTKEIDWHWHIVHGAAANTGSTRWCQPQRPRLSRDGTNELLQTWRSHPRITIHERPMWALGKDEMFREALKQVKEPTVLLQADADEFWEPEQLETLVGFFNAYQEIVCARFFCQYFVGPNIIITSEHSYGNRPTEWLRAWRYAGQRFLTHEPPLIEGLSDPCATREQTRDAGLVFQHHAYVYDWQLEFKMHFYGYPNAVTLWKKLQLNKTWPVSNLRDFLPWVDAGVTADLLHR